jgi:hypothetical protein
MAHIPAQMMTCFVQCWTLEVTLEEARAHLGMETQRQWHERAIARRTAWYRKTRPTFVDAIALVRRQLWDHIHFSTSPQEIDMIQIPRALFERIY